LEKLGYSLSEVQQTTPVAILSTASPCKFEESVTVALGKDGWNRYYQEEFPERARDVMSRKEVEPILYTKDQDWETLARNIIKELGQVEG
jgi:threonine synthase